MGKRRNQKDRAIRIINAYLCTILFRVGMSNSAHIKIEKRKGRGAILCNLIDLVSRFLLFIAVRAVRA